MRILYNNGDYIRLIVRYPDTPMPGFFLFWPSGNPLDDADILEVLASGGTFKPENSTEAVIVSQIVSRTIQQTQKRSAVNACRRYLTRSG